MKWGQTFLVAFRYNQQTQKKLKGHDPWSLIPNYMNTFNDGDDEKVS